MSTRMPRAGAFRHAAARTGLVGVLVAGLTGVGATAASAHHPEVDASTDCTGVVQFTSRAWNGDTDASRTNSDVDIHYRVDGGDWTEVEPAEDETFAFTPGNEFGFSGDFTPEAAQPGDTVTVRASVAADWGNGTPAGDASRSSRTDDVTVEEPCPSGQSARVGEIDCEQGGAAVDLTNDSAEPAEFTLVTTEGEDETTETVEVPAETTQRHWAPVSEDATATVAVSAPDMETVEEEVSRDCHEAKPSATVDSDCDGTDVTLDNTEGAQAAVFTVTGPSGETREVEVPEGEERTDTFPPTDDTNATVTVAAPGMEPLTTSVARDCAEPGPVVEAQATCAGFAVRLANDGDEAATFTVALPGGATEEHVLEPGDAPRRLDYEPDTTDGVLTVSSAGTEDVTAEMPGDCPAEDAGGAQPVDDDTQGRTGESEALADTGASSLGVLAALAGGLLAVGAGVTLLARRRRTSTRG
jgi:hypothetical protein